MAKIASKWQKPAGLTVISGKDLHLYLDKVPIEDVWGIGAQTTAYLTRFGIATALDFARRDEHWVRTKLTKPHQDLAGAAGNGGHSAGDRREAHLPVDQQDQDLHPAFLRPGLPAGPALEKRRERLYQSAAV